jgi:hypothetical protein
VIKHRVLIAFWLVLCCQDPSWGQCSKKQENIKLIEEHDQQSHEFRMAHWILLTVFQDRSVEAVELVENAAAAARSELERQRLLLMVKELRKTLQAQS